MTRILITILLMVVSIRGLCQRIEYTFAAPGDTTKNYYVTVFPKGKINGAIILLPGFGELPGQTLIESDIYKYADDEGYLTIIPALGDWSFFYIDDGSHQKLDVFIDEVFRKYNLHEGSFFIGGHSFGGTMALQYTQRAYRDRSKLKKPVAVFALDPPLDIERLYNCMTTTNRPTKNPISIQEDTYVANRIQEEFQKNPRTDPEFFWNVSPYAQSDGAHNSLRTLLSVPVRIYNEPDINWYLEERNIDFYCMNSLDSAAMINWLKFLGNSRAELIVTSGRGYRVGRKMRHPHSWSIADGRELIGWMTRQVSK